MFLNILHELLLQDSIKMANELYDRKTSKVLPLSDRKIIEK